MRRDPVGIFRFLIDAQLPATLAQLLQRSGHDAVHVSALPAGSGPADGSTVARPRGCKRATQAPWQQVHGARTLDTVKVRRSVRKHGVTEQDVTHAFRSAIKFISYEYDGEERLLVIAPARNGAMLELTAVPPTIPTASSTPIISGRRSTTT
jgi:uncharacterized DUF497 family protein